MATYWHPFLSQFIKEDYGDRLDVKDSVKLGEMPLEMDILIKPLVLIDELPYPFNHLGETTIRDTIILSIRFTLMLSGRCQK